MRQLKGLNAVVIGGGSGIGRGAVHALARRGVNLLIADLRGASAETVAAESAGFDVRTSAMTCDVTDAAQVEALAARAYEAFTAVNILINSPGIVLTRLVEEAEPDDWRRILDVNLLGIIQCCRAFAPRMKRQGPGLAHIVNNASMAALAPPLPGLGLYSVTKQALLAYSEALASEFAESGLSVSLLAAGRVATGLGANSADYLAARAEGREPSIVGAASADSTIMSADEAGEIVARGIEANRFLILTHPERRGEIAERFARLLAEIDTQAARPHG